MQLTIISFLAFSCAVLAESCDTTTDCLCKLWVGGNALQGVVPGGTGSIQSDMAIMPLSNSSNLDIINACSVTLDRGQGCCDQFNVTAGPIGLGCPKGSNVLLCGEQIPFTLSYYSTVTATITSYTAVGASTLTSVAATVPTTFLTTGTVTAITDTTMEVSATAAATSYADNLDKRQLSSSANDVSVSVGIAVYMAYVTLSTVVVVTSNVTAYYSTTDFSAVTTTMTSTSETTTVVATTTTVAIENYTLEFGPVDGCAYTPLSFIDQTSFPVDTSCGIEQQLEFCAQFCDKTSGCVSFGSNFFPPCGLNAAYVDCILSAYPYAGAGEVECGIGQGSGGCSFCQRNTVYQRT